MTLQASGPISARDINAEFGRGATSSVPLGADFVRAYAGVMRGPIRFSDFYGKSNYVPMTVTPHNSSTYYNTGYGSAAPSATPSVSVVNGVPPYTYSWLVTAESGTRGAVKPASNTGSSYYMYLIATRNSSGWFDVILQCTVTDAKGVSVTVGNIHGYAFWESML